METKLSKLIAAVILFSISFSATAQTFFERNESSDSVKYRDFQISFVPMFGTSEGPEEGFTNKFSLNILAGYEHSLKGAEFGGLYNVNLYNVEGGQFSGFGNVAGGDVKGGQFAGFINTVKGGVNGGQYAGTINVTLGQTTGVQASGLINYNHQHLKGAQLTGGINVVKDSVRGFQGAGLVNVAIRKATGAQAAGILNYADSVSGSQIAGLVNTSIRGVDGSQLAGLVNVSTKGVEGAQLAGLVNVATDVKGLQMSGLVNTASNVRGTQIGLINIADSLKKGVAIGLINISRNGLIQPGVEHNDVIDATLTFRSGSHKLYSILLAGMDSEDDYLWTYGAGFGTQFNLKSNWVTNIELTAQQINPKDQHADYVNILHRLSWNFGYQFARHLGISAGPALNIYVTDQPSSSTDVKGFDIGNDSFYDKNYGDTNVRMWVGYNVAIKF